MEKGPDQDRKLNAFEQRNNLGGLTCDISNSNFRIEMANACAIELSPQRTAEIERVRIQYELDGVSCSPDGKEYTWEISR
jgi:hypothetical protein